MGFTRFARRGSEACMQCKRAFKINTSVFLVRFTLLGYAVLTQKLVTGWPLMYLKQEGVWHFNGNIPLDLVSDEGDTYIEVTFVEIS